MSQALFLTQSELINLTGKCRPTAQARQLEFMGISFLKRRDGSICVNWDGVGARSGARPEREPSLRLAK